MNKISEKTAGELGILVVPPMGEEWTGPDMSSRELLEKYGLWTEDDTKRIAELDSASVISGLREQE